jgi:hypothetical protein
VQEVDLPGFEYAVIVSYDEAPAPGQVVHTDHLVGDLPDGSVALLVVKAERQRYESERLGASPVSARSHGAASRHSSATSPGRSVGARTRAARSRRTSGTLE